jgi:ligand-binding sensor domain-containing protein
LHEESLAVNSMRWSLLSLLTLTWMATPAAGAADWQSAPLFGGEVHSIAFAPTDPTVVVAGTAAGQIYRSSDSGASWAPAGRTFPLPGWVVAALHFDPNRPQRVWAGMRGVWGGGAVAYSDDLGETWEMVARRLDDTLFSLALVPGQVGRLFIGTRSGVWGSADDGASWRHLSAGQEEIVEVSSLIAPPGLSGSVVAGTYRRAFRSDDGGETWNGIFDGMVLDTQLSSLQPVPGRPGDLWASTCGWVYHWSESNRRWVRSRDGLAERRTQSFQVLPGGRLLAGTVAGVYASEDDGRSWARRTRDDLSILAMAHHPERPQVVLAGTEGAGIWRSNDGGLSFAPSSRGLTAARVSALAVEGDRLLVAVAHGGPSSGLYAAVDDGRRVVQLQSELPTVLSLAAAGGRAWAATEKGLYARRDGLWQHVGELREERIEQVLTDGDRLLVRTASALLEERQGRLVPLATPPAGRPVSVAFHGGELWVSATEGVSRMAQDHHRTVAAPVAGAQIGSLGSRMLLAGAAGAWSRDGAGSPWHQHGEERSRLVATGAPAFPALLVVGESAELFDAARGEFVPLALPFSGRYVLGAAVLGGRLFLGTSGLGLVSAQLRELAPGALGTPAAVAAPPP